MNIGKPLEPLTRALQERFFNSRVGHSIVLDFLSPREAAFASCASKALRVFVYESYESFIKDLEDISPCVKVLGSIVKEEKSMVGRLVKIAEFLTYVAELNRSILMPCNQIPLNAGFPWGDAGDPADELTVGLKFVGYQAVKPGTLKSVKYITTLTHRVSLGALYLYAIKYRESLLTSKNFALLPVGAFEIACYHARSVKNPKIQGELISRCSNVCYHHFLNQIRILVMMQM